MAERVKKRNEIDWKKFLLQNFSSQKIKGTNFLKRRNNWETKLNRIERERKEEKERQNTIPLITQVFQFSDRSLIWKTCWKNESYIKNSVPVLTDRSFREKWSNSRGRKELIQVFEMKPLKESCSKGTFFRHEELRRERNWREGEREERIMKIRRRNTLHSNFFLEVQQRERKGSEEMSSKSFFCVI